MSIGHGVVESPSPVSTRTDASSTIDERRLTMTTAVILLGSIALLAAAMGQATAASEAAPLLHVSVSHGTLTVDVRDAPLITLAANATLRFSAAGVYNIRSIVADKNADLLFQNLGSGTADVRMLNQVITGHNIYDLTTMNGIFDVYLAERDGRPDGAELTVEGTGSVTTFIDANNTLAGPDTSFDERGTVTTVPAGTCGAFPG